MNEVKIKKNGIKRNKKLQNRGDFRVGTWEHKRGHRPVKEP